MIFAYGDNAPSIDTEAWVAPDATVSGRVSIGAGSRVMHGARIVAEGGGSVRIGRRCIVMENAVIRATARHACAVGDHCLVGPGSHVVGADVEDEVFIATGAAVFHGARLGRGSEARINGTVHLRTLLPRGATVPIGWVAVGDPAAILPPSAHDAIWARQAPLDFPGFVYGFDRSTPGLMREVTTRLSDQLGAHRESAEVVPGAPR